MYQQYKPLGSQNADTCIDLITFSLALLEDF